MLTRRTLIPNETSPSRYCDFFHKLGANVLAIDPNLSTPSGLERCSRPLSPSGNGFRGLTLADFWSQVQRAQTPHATAGTVGLCESPTRPKDSQPRILSAVRPNHRLIQRYQQTRGRSATRCTSRLAICTSNQAYSIPGCRLLKSRLCCTRARIGPMPWPPIPASFDYSPLGVDVFGQHGFCLP